MSILIPNPVSISRRVSALSFQPRRLDAEFRSISAPPSFIQFQPCQVSFRCPPVSASELPSPSPPSPPQTRLETLIAAIRQLAVVRRVIVLDDLDYLHALDKSFMDAVINWALSGIDQLVLVLTTKSTIGLTSADSAPPPR